MEELNNALLEETGGLQNEDINLDDLSGEAGPESSHRPETAMGSVSGEDHEESGAFDAAEGESGALFTVKYNGEEKKLPLHEMLTLAQKGMNYDKVYQRVQQAQNSREVQLLDRLAKEAGVGREEYVAHLEEGRKTSAAQAIMQEKGVGEDVAREMLAMQEERLAREEGAHTAYAERQEKEFVALAQKYPGVKELPPEVAQMIAQGVPPVYAYENFVGQTLRAKLAALEATVKNRRTAPGSAAGLGGGEAKDPFLSGFQGM